MGGPPPGGARHLGFRLRETDDLWAKAAVVASHLDPAQVEETVRDPYERAELYRLRPTQAVPGSPDSPAARIAARITTADDDDEIGWLRADLAQAVVEARRYRPAPGAPRAAGRSSRGREHPPGTADAGGSDLLTRHVRLLAPRELLTGRARAGALHARRHRSSRRNSPSWTTETSSRPSMS
ncbi:DUF6397 family protein [Streptomyces sp. NPDC057062]|uniref:DUF6397 family protein n=1 Tax=Streptomyces sp. NPDC057062 TaxID=3346011 RepID=UPI003624FE39